MRPTSGNGKRGGGNDNGAGIVVGKHFPTSRFGTIIARYPTLTFFFSAFPYIILLLVLLIGVDPEVDAAEGSFRPISHVSAIQYNKAEELENQWFAKAKLGNSDTIGSRASGSLTYRSVVSERIEIRYSISGRRIANSILAQGPMQTIRLFEQTVLNEAAVKEVCLNNNGWGQRYILRDNTDCVPMVSLTTFVFPGNTTSFTAGYPLLPNDGVGGEYQVPSHRLMDRIFSNPNYKWFLDATFTPANPISANSRAHLILGSPIPISGGASTRVAGVKDTRKKYMAAARTIADLIERANTNQNDVVFSMTSELLDEAVATDAASTSLLLLCAAVVVLGIVIFVRTGSIFLGIMGVVFNILAFMANMAIYSALSGGTLPLLALAAVFLLVSLNVQNLLLTVDTFRHSGMMASSGRDNDLSLSQRISYCIRHAGGASFTIQLLMLIMFSLIATLDVAALRSVALFCLLMLVWIVYNTLIFHNAMVGFYHVQFAGNGRLRQRQINARRRRDAEGGSMLRRNKALKAVLQTLEEHPLPGELSYSSMREQVEAQKTRRKNVTSTKSITKVLAGIRDDTLAHLKALSKQQGTSKKKTLKEEALRAERLRARNGRSGDAAMEEGSYAGFNANSINPAGTFEMSDFAEAGEVLRAHGFTSSRMVPTISLLHLSVGTLRRTPESDGSDSSDTGDASAPRGRIPMSEAEAGIFEAAIAEADAHVLELMGEAEARSSSSNSSSSTSPNAPREFSDTETDNPLHDHASLYQPQDGAPVRVNISSNPASPKQPAMDVLSNGSMSGSMRILSPLSATSTVPHSKLNTDTARFIAKWSFVGNTLICGRTPTNTTWEVSAPAMPFVAAMLSNTLLGDNVEGFGTVLIPREARRKLKKRTPLSDETKASKKKRVKWYAKLKRRWKDRSDEPQRRWFCCGRRVGETRDEKDSRLMEKVAKPPKYTPGERFVRGPMMKGLNLLRIPLICICLALLAVFSYYASELTNLTYSRMDLVEGSLRQQFDQAGALQAYPTAPCDYCSNYYSKADAFRGTKMSEYATCAPQFGWEQHNLYVDTCGKCMGDDECQRCDGNGYDPSEAGYALVEDSCGLCRVPTSTSGGTPPCGECVYATENCSQCQVDGRTSYFAGGASCGVTCPSDCTGGCNPYTGTCIGYATTAACLGRGLIHPSSSFSTTNCSCYGAWAGDMCQFCGCTNGGQCHPTTGVCQCPAAYAGARCESCSVGCTIGGACQGNWTIGELLLPSCVALRCPASDIQSGTICSACSSKLLSVSLGPTTAASCWALGVGAWDGSQCRAFQYSTGPTTCVSTCRGYWSGSDCSTCSIQGGHCLPDGSVMACDKNIYIINTTATDYVPSTKNCNTCGLGVTCAVAVLNRQPESIEIPFRAFISVSRSIDDPVAETQIRSFVNDVVLAVRFPGGPVAASISALFPTALVDFYNSLEYADNSTASQMLSVRLQNFLTNNARLPEIGLTFYNNWYVVMTGAVSCPLPCSSSEIAKRMGKFEGGLTNVARSHSYLTVSLQSSAWMDAVVGEYLEVVLIKLTILGLVLFTCVLLGTTASLRLTAFGLVTMGCTVAGTLSVLTWLSHPISPASTIAYAIVMCIPAQYSIHLTLQYVDTLEGETLSIFSGGSTTYFALKQAMTRTVPSMLTCTVATLAVGVVLLLSELVPVRELAMCIMVATSMALFFTLLFLPPLILLLGPTITRRHKIFLVIFVAIGLVASIVVLLL